MNQTYISEVYPNGKVRTARSAHVCDGALHGPDPGCGDKIVPGVIYFDTCEKDLLSRRTGHFCTRCAQIESMNIDLFEWAGS